MWNNVHRGPPGTHLATIPGPMPLVNGLVALPSRCLRRPFLATISKVEPPVQAHLQAAPKP
jgi:hypothetical protein